MSPYTFRLEASVNGRRWQPDRMPDVPETLDFPGPPPARRGGQTVPGSS